jgi:hypothetical protein
LVLKGSQDNAQTLRVSDETRNPVRGRRRAKRLAHPKG